MLSRRHFLSLTGLAGLPLLGVRGLAGCASNESTAAPPTKDPLPDDPTKPWWLRGDYAPVDETAAFDLEIVGALPPTLNGLYLRNGPNPLHDDSPHWFLGDGMVHGVMLQAGSALWYRARYVKTAVLGMMTTDTQGPPGLKDHQANTSVLAYQNRLLCLEEIGLPYELSPSDLSTLGTYDFAGKLTTPMTAHPKVDPVTGELLFFGYSLLDPSIAYHRVDATGALVQSETIALPKAIMMHDFQITQTHVVFMDLPIVFDLELAISGDSLPFRWDPANGARLGVMPRTGTAADVKWTAIDPCFVFHTWNAFHDPSNPAIIHLDGIRYPSEWVQGPSDFSTNGRPHRFSINATAGTVALTQLDDSFVELPRINRARQGSAYRYAYALGTNAAPPPPGTLVPPNQIVKYDRVTGARSVFTAAAGQEVDEALFVADPQGSAEDDGWLLAYVFDHADNRSQLFVFDATNVAAGPVARVKLPHRVPHGFHGDFVPSKV